MNFLCDVLALSRSAAPWLRWLRMAGRSGCWILRILAGGGHVEATSARRACRDLGSSDCRVRHDVFTPARFRALAISSASCSTTSLFNDKMEELRREALLRELRQRFRDVRQGPDGLL